MDSELSLLSNWLCITHWENYRSQTSPTDSTDEPIFLGHRAPWPPTWTGTYLCCACDLKGRRSAPSKLASLRGSTGMAPSACCSAQDGDCRAAVARRVAGTGVRGTDQGVSSRTEPCAHPSIRCIARPPWRDF